MSDESAQHELERILFSSPPRPGCVRGLLVALIWNQGAIPPRQGGTIFLPRETNFVDPVDTRRGAEENRSVTPADRASHMRWNLDEADGFEVAGGPEPSSKDE
jgi:hypothetical protein